MEGVESRNGLYGFEFRDIDKRRVEERSTYDIKQLWQRSHEIVNLSARGFKNVEIADILNITPATVSNTLNGELGQRKLSEIRLCRDDEAKKVTEKIRVLTNKALQTYHEIFDDETGEATIKDRKSVADTVLLELSGLRAPTKHISANLTSEEIEAFKHRGKVAAEQEGVVIDVEPEDEKSEDDEPKIIQGSFNY